MLLIRISIFIPGIIAYFPGYATSAFRGAGEIDLFPLLPRKKFLISVSVVVFRIIIAFRETRTRSCKHCEGSAISCLTRTGKLSGSDVSTWRFR